MVGQNSVPRRRPEDWSDSPAPARSDLLQELMDLSETEYTSESKSVYDVVVETVTDEVPKSVKETHSGNENGTPQDRPIEEGLEEEKEVSLDKTQTEPTGSLSQEFTQATVEPVEETPQNRFEQPLELEESNGSVIDSVSKETDLLSAENGVSPALIDSASEGTTELPSSDEIKEVSALVMDSEGSKGTEEREIPVSGGNPEESSTGAVDLALNENAANTTILQSEDVRCCGVDADNGGGEDSNMSEFPESSGNQAFVAVPPRPLQRTSWRGCCGLFEILRRSDSK